VTERAETERPIARSTLASVPAALAPRGSSPTDEELTLLQFGVVLARSWRLVVGTPLIVCAVVGILVLVLPPTYTATTSFHTTFVYDRATDSWQWHMDNDSVGVCRPFARVTLTRR